MPTRTTLALGSLELRVAEQPWPKGRRVLAALVEMADAAVAALNAQSNQKPMAVMSRLRGTGRGVHLGTWFDELEAEFPLTLQAPFEDSPKVSGTVWRADSLLPGSNQAAVAKLRWEAGATDLPMHVHPLSDRCIIVRQGRGYFHVSDESLAEFSGQNVRSIPARERDVFLFTRGVVHTFSTDTEPMVLFSCQLPFFDFDNPEQYQLPTYRWTAATEADRYTPKVACDPGWMVLAEAEAE